MKFVHVSPTPFPKRTYHPQHHLPRESPTPTPPPAVFNLPHVSHGARAILEERKKEKNKRPGLDYKSYFPVLFRFFFFFSFCLFSLFFFFFLLGFVPLLRKRFRKIYAFRTFSRDHTISSNRPVRNVLGVALNINEGGRSIVRSS